MIFVEEKTELISKSNNRLDYFEISEPLALVYIKEWVLQNISHPSTNIILLYTSLKPGSVRTSAATYGHSPRMSDLIEPIADKAVLRSAAFLLP